VIPVEDMSRCPYEGQMMPAGHACIGNNLSCPTAEGRLCRCCLSCLVAQAEDLTWHPDGLPEEPPPVDGWDADGQPVRDVNVSPDYL
jgi:hypothetical protein